MRKRRMLMTASTRRRFSPLSLIGVVVTLAVVVAGVLVFVIPRLGTHAAGAAPNGDCTVIVPPDPLTAKGLATPYQLTATNAANGPCNEANTAQAVFVQAAVIDPATGQISIYNPLVIDKGTKPAAAPVVPQLPAGGVVGIWFGGDDANTTLQATNGSLAAGKCVNGLPGSVFGQVAFCNAAAFFTAANQAIQAGKLTPPALGTAKDGLPCPSVRDFSMVDQDQSDNVTTKYLVTADGTTAQSTAANKAALANATILSNGSDEGLLDGFLDPALGCTPWMAPDLADKGNMVPAQPLNELQAAADQVNPVALVPNGDPMVLDNNKINMQKLNLYRAGVDQPVVTSQRASSTVSYCNNLVAIAPLRLQVDESFFIRQPSPAPDVANSLFTFLAQRLATSYGKDGGLNCQGLLKQPNPISIGTDSSGVVTSASINGAVFDTPIDCEVNGKMVLGCDGTIDINGKPCSVLLDRTTNKVVISCPPKAPATNADQNQPAQ